MMKMLSRATGLTIVVGFLVPGNVLAAPICELSSWPVLRSQNRGPSDNELRAVTAVSRKDVWAVGWYVDAATRSNTPLTQHWDGSVWGVVPAAPPGLIGSLQGVDAASSDDVWAVGSSRTELQTSAALAVHWDGTAWKIVEVPAPEAGPFVSMVLTDVEALGPDDMWAVGYWSSVPEAPPSPLIEHWDGRRWEVVDSPDLGTWSELHGVAGTGPDDVWAVGNTEVRVGADFVERALIEHWDGTAWRLVRAPFVARRSPFTLESVDVRSPADAWAVGQVTRPTAVVTISFHWDGTHWARVPTVNPSEEFQLLGGVAMASRNKVWAVGTYFDAARGQDATLVERWNGRRWVRERSATRRGSSQLFDVAALPSRRFAVGSYWANGGEGPQRTLVLSRCPV